MTGWLPEVGEMRVCRQTYRSCVRSEIGRRDLGGREGLGAALDEQMVWHSSFSAMECRATIWIRLPIPDVEPWLVLFDSGCGSGA